MQISNNQYTNLTIEAYLYSLQQRNLVYNYDFRYFSNQTHNKDENGDITEYGIPDGWQYVDNGPNGTITFDDANNLLKLMKSSNDSLMSFKQALHEFPRWEQMLLGETITAKVVLSMVSGEVNITLSDGISSNTVTKTGKGDFEVEVQLKINEEAKSVYVEFSSNVAFTGISISYVCANVGEIALKNLPCIVQGIIGERKQYIATETPPAEELSLCLGTAPFELCGNYTRLKSVLQDRFGVGKNGNPLLLNMSGYFSRAWNNGADIDPDANNRTPPPGTETLKGDHVSTFEGDVFLTHKHGLNFSIPESPTLTGGEKPLTPIISVGENASTTNNAVDSKDGKETRPKNIAELYTIKWA